MKKLSYLLCIVLGVLVCLPTASFSYSQKCIDETYEIIMVPYENEGKCCMHVMLQKKKECDCDLCGISQIDVSRTDGSGMFSLFGVPYGADFAWGSHDIDGTIYDDVIYCGGWCANSGDSHYDPVTNKIVTTISITCRFYTEAGGMDACGTLTIDRSCEEDCGNETNIVLNINDFKEDGICKSQCTANVTGPHGPYTYDWGCDGIFGDPMPNIIDVFPATHCVTVRDARGCERTEMVTNHMCNMFFTAGPNPNNGLFDITVELTVPASLEVIVYDLNMQPVFYQDYGLQMTGTPVLNVNMLGTQTGSYYAFLKVDGVQTQESVQVIIQQGQ
jgi:hypothetical protein